jgi:hypothetical protein
MRRGRLLILLGGALLLIAVERLVNASLLGGVTNESRSVRLAIAFVCGGLAPLCLGVGLLQAASGLFRTRAPADEETDPEP